MKKRQLVRILSLILSLMLVFSAPGCRKSPENNESSERITVKEKDTEENSSAPEESRETEEVDRTTAEALEEQEAFKEFSDKVFTEVISENTLNLHCTLSHPENYGIDDYDISFGSFDKEEEAEEYEEMEEYLREIKKFNYSLLTDEQQLAYDVFVTDIGDSLKGKDYRLYGNAMSPGMGIQSYIPIILAEYVFYDEQDIKDYLNLLKEIEPYYKEMIEYEKEQSKAGFFMQDFSADKVIEECQQFISKPDSHYLIESFNERIGDVDFIDEGAKKSYQKQNEKAIKETVIPAYEYLIQELTKLKGTGAGEGGLANYKNGKKYYEMLVRSYTGSDKSVEEIKSIIEKEYKADYRRILAMSFTNSSDIETMFDYPGDLSDPKKVLEELQQKIAEDFPEGPEVKYTVNYVPKSMEEHTNPAYYITAPIDDLNNNPIYINKSMTSDGVQDFATLAHEGFPGHLYQTTYFNNQEVSSIRHLCSFDGYTEGWGTYAELYSYGIAGLSDAAEELNVINTTYGFAIYCLVDIGVNYEGWSRQETMEFLEEKGITGKDADTIYETMVEQPAVYLAYYFGYLEFMDMREDAQERLGDRFSMKEFHEFILKTGPAQFEIVRDKMNDWIEQKS